LVLDGSIRRWRPARIGETQRAKAKLLRHHRIPAALLSLPRRAQFTLEYERGLPAGGGTKASKKQFAGEAARPLGWHPGHALLAAAKRVFAYNAVTPEAVERHSAVMAACFSPHGAVKHRA